MNFDRLAPFYSGLENLFAGGLMQRCRVGFLAQTKDCRFALLVGEGAGKFLVELLRRNPGVRVTCLEQSQGMIRQARRRLVRERQDLSRVRFIPLDALHWTPPAEKYDLVATHFFLDCFRPDQLRELIPRLAGSAHADARWLLADFRVPDRGWRRWRARAVLAALYGFFKLATSLPARRLTPPDPFLTAAGFTLAERRLMNFGFAHTDLWTRGGGDVSAWPPQNQAAPAGHSPINR